MIDKPMMALMDKTLRALGFNPETANLKFADRNRKLDDIITFSMPAGHSCPFAKDCRSCATLKVARSTNTASAKGKFSGFGIEDGPDTQFRCFTAIDEVLRPGVRRARWHNFLTLLHVLTKGKQATVELIERSMPPAKWGKPTRVHVAGDFFTQKYFDAWMDVARRNPTRLFYAYTKALPLWVKRLDNIPSNFKLTASYGGTHDWMIEDYNLRFAKVVKSVQEAAELGLTLDHDDSHAYGNGGSFALLVHGQQPAGTVWAKAWAALKKIGIGGYGKTKAVTKTAGAKSVSAGGVLRPYGWGVFLRALDISSSIGILLT